MCFYALEMARPQALLYVDLTRSNIDDSGMYELIRHTDRVLNCVCALSISSCWLLGFNDISSVQNLKNLQHLDVSNATGAGSTPPRDCRHNDDVHEPDGFRHEQEPRGRRIFQRDVGRFA